MTTKDNTPKLTQFQQVAQAVQRRDAGTPQPNDLFLLMQHTALAQFMSDSFARSRLNHK